MQRVRGHIIRFAVWLLCCTPFCIVWYLRATNRIAAVQAGVTLIVSLLLGVAVMHVFVWRTQPPRPRRPMRPIRHLPPGVILSQAGLLLAAGVVIVAELLRLHTASLGEHLVAWGLALALLGIVLATFRRFGIL
jgi:hypothetical protein